jgi:hypothetical protein
VILIRFVKFGYFKKIGNFCQKIKESYCYLGVTASYTGILSQTSKNLMEKGRKAWFKIKKTITLNSPCNLLEKPLFWILFLLTSNFQEEHNLLSTFNPFCIPIRQKYGILYFSDNRNASL